MNKHFFSPTFLNVSARSALSTAIAAAYISIAAPSWAFNSGSTGVDGALNPAVSTEIQLPPSGILNYSSINIPAGVVVTFKKNAANTPVYLLVSGAATIAGVIDIGGRGSKNSGTYGDGNLADDGIPGVGGPGGFDGGRGGRDDQALTPAIIRGGAGLGPGGGGGATEIVDGQCAATGRYFNYFGMGGSYAAKGSNYRYEAYCGSTPAQQAIDAAAKPYGSPSLQPLIGGSGGGGGRGGANYAGSGGAGGGGAILIAVSGTFTLSSGAQILAWGGTAGGTNGPGRGYEGAGGSGGAIRIIATSFTGSGVMYATGGCSYAQSTSLVNCGSGYGYYDNELGGSVGRIRVEADNVTYSGTSNPPYVVDTPSAIFVSNIPSLRIASIAGSVVPTNPTGTADVALPATLTNPVSVNFETTNIPPGSTVELRVVPAYGAVVKALSPAITGSNASGNTSVSVSLPQGPSTLQAITSYTVTVAMGESLSRFAQNERVEKVEIIAGLGAAESTARLITVSGKSFDVPISILQLVGSNG